MESSQINLKTLTSSRYETQTALDEYLLFHYGSDDEQMPFDFGPKSSAHFPIRCVTECLDVSILPSNPRGLELGCAVGRSSFELARYCETVVAVDSSSSFISAARQIQREGLLEYSILNEKGSTTKKVAKLPHGINPDCVAFRCCDVMDLFLESTSYHVVLAANLLCRLQNPSLFLALLPEVVSKGGQLILISPYSWSEEFTPQNHWIVSEAKTPLESLQEKLENHFDLHHIFDMPFLIREHWRKYQWGISQATIWRKK